jgi:hypothetical protein
VRERTQTHLAAADRHRAAAEFLRASADTEPYLREWFVVAAFYATVHYINAYLWEQQQLEPANHTERSQLVMIVRDLRPIRGAYGNLRDSAYLCRYDPLHRESAADLAGHLRDLRAVQRTINALIPQS